MKESSSRDSDRKKIKRIEYEAAVIEKRDRMLIKDRTSERAVMEEVFDQKTLMTVYGLMNDGVISEIIGTVKAGKESRIYWGKSPEDSDLAIKIYLTTSAEFRRGMLPYIVGDPRFRRIRRDTRSLVYAWAQKEFKNLKLAHEAGVRVPKPIAVSRNVLVMEFIGREGVSAPLLKDVKLESYKKVYLSLLEYVRRLYRSKLVHSDLSEYNVMIWDDEVVIFDLSQAVLLEHPMAKEFLLRDLRNLAHFFRKRGLETPDAENLLKEVAEDV